MQKITNDLLALAQNGDETAVAALIARMMPAIRKGAAAATAPGLDFEDAVQEGLIGLFEAMHRYDTAAGMAFASFAAELNTSLIAIMNRMIPPDNSSDACVRFRYFRIAPPQNRKRSRTPSAIRDSLITIKRYLAAPVPSSSAIKTGRLPSGFMTRKNKISVETKLSINTPFFHYHNMKCRFCKFFCVCGISTAG